MKLFVSPLQRHKDISSLKIHFGDTLSLKIDFASLSNAVGVWFNTNKQTKGNLILTQYRFAKAVLKLHCMPLKRAISIDFAWLPITNQPDIIQDF